MGNEEKEKGKEGEGEGRWSGNWRKMFTFSTDQTELEVEVVQKETTGMEE